MRETGIDQAKLQYPNNVFEDTLSLKVEKLNSRAEFTLSSFEFYRVVTSFIDISLYPLLGYTHDSPSDACHKPFDIYQFVKLK